MQLRKIVNWEGDQPAGRRFHSAAFDENGAHITDIWDSPEPLQSFVDNRLMPGVQQVGVADQPTVEIYPLHALYQPEPILEPR